MIKRGLLTIGMIGVLGYLLPLCATGNNTISEEDELAISRFQKLEMQSHEMEIDLINPLLEPVKGYTYPKRVQYEFAPDVKAFKLAMHKLKDLLLYSKTIDDFIIPLFYRQTSEEFQRRFHTLVNGLFDILPDGAYWETVNRNRRMMEDMWIHAVPYQNSTESTFTFEMILKEFEENKCPFFIETEENIKNFEKDQGLLKSLYEINKKDLSDISFAVHGIYLYGRAMPEREFVGVPPKEFWAYWDLKTDTLTHIP